MKNRIILMAAAIAAMMVSCQKEETPAVDSNYEVLTLTAVDSQETKTSLSGSSVLWTDDDVVAVFDAKNDKNEFKVDKSVEFSATAPIFSGKVSKGTQDFYAVYPYERANSADGGILSVTIPADQTSKVGSFAEEHNISVAKGTRGLGDGTDCSVTFKNVCALLKFTVPTFVGTVSEVTVNNENVIAGDMEVNYIGDEPVCSISSGSTSVSMSGEFAAGSTFYFVVAPTSLKNVSVTVTVGTENPETFSMQVARDADEIPLVAGQYKNLGTLKLAASVNAIHTQDESGDLNGTKLQIALPDAADKIKSMDLNVSGAINWSGITSLEWDGVTNEEYTYLPQGTYTLSGSYTLKNGTTVTLGNTSFEVEAPDFVTVTQSKSYTSYTKYKSEGAAAGNALSGLTLYALKNGVSANISQALYNKYGACEITTEVDGATVDGDNKVYGANELGSKSVVNCVTFAGHKFSSDAKVYDITGIPYSLANDGTWENIPLGDGWVSGNIKGNVIWSGNSVMLGNNLSVENIFGGGNLNTVAELRKSFHIPSEISVSVTASGSVYSDMKTQSTTGSIIVGSTTVCEGSAKGQSSGWFGLGTEPQNTPISCTPESVGSVGMAPTNNTVQLRNSNGSFNLCTTITVLLIEYINS